MSHAVVFIPLFLLVLLAAVIDWRTRTISNAMNLLILCTGLGLAWQGMLHISLMWSVAGVGVGFILLFPAFALGAMGGGDVKLLAAIGAWCGPVGAVAVLVIATLVGMVIAVVQAAQSGKLTMLLRNSGLLAINLLHARTVGVDHIEQTGKGFHSIDRPLPYAVPLLVGVLAWCLAM